MADESVVNGGVVDEEDQGAGSFYDMEAETAKVSVLVRKVEDLDNQIKRKSRFCYIRAWEDHKGLKGFVARHWNSIDHPNALMRLGLKLKNLRHHLRIWNWEIFGNIKQKIRDIQANINRLECSLQISWDDSDEQDLEVQKSTLNQLLDQERSIAYDQAKLSWLKEGDANTAFFHTAIKVRKANNDISLLDGNGEPLEDDAAGEKAVDYFRELLSQQTLNVDESQFGLFSNIMSDSENEAITACPSMDEIWNVLSEMNHKSSPGPDGFTSLFFVSNWETVGKDFIEAIQAFFQGEQIPKIISSTLITLIPKTQQANDLNHLRPISLCNVVHKVISSILNSRLSSFIQRMISPEQCGFIKGRNIQDNIALAHELTQDLKIKTFGGNVMIKLDMSKAYDRVSWDFILKIFKASGFSDQWCALISRCINNCWYSINWKGKHYGYFKSHCGVRQGDPLSPSLFLLAMEWFSRLLAKEISEGRIFNFFSGRRVTPISHLLFADDMLIFTNGAKRSMDHLLTAIETFCRFSGQQLNSNKSLIFFSKHITRERRRTLQDLTKFSVGNFPTSYLGVPLFIGKPKIAYFNYLIEKISVKLGGWAKKLLSMGGKLALIKSVLNSIPLHSMASLPIPRTVIKRCSTLICNFLWDNGNQHRHHWVSWDNVCKPMAAGGLGVTSLEDMKLSLQGSMAWRVNSSNNLLANYLKKKYAEGRQGSSLWNNLQPLMTHIQENSGWILGNGDTTTKVCCEAMGVPCPDYIRHMSMKQVMLNPTAKNIFLDHLHPSRHSLFEQFIPSSSPDRLIWTGSQQGIFSTKAFRYSYATLHQNTGWGDLIWQSWIQPKISCFVWRLCLKALPTDDNVKKLSVALPSRCVCCQSNEESLEHLFFQGSWARCIWSFLHHSLGIHVPRSLREFRIACIGSRSPKSLADGIKLSMICFSVWELWKSRNSLIHEQKKPDLVGAVVRWIKNTYSHINLPVRGNMDRIAKLFGITIQSAKRNISWRQWQPCSSGETINIACVQGVCAFIVRNSHGRFIRARCWRSQVLRDLDELLHAITEAAKDLRSAVVVQTSSMFMGDIIFAKELYLPWDSVMKRRQFLMQFPHVNLQKINAGQNNPAIAMAAIADTGSFCEVKNLPMAVQLALHDDASRIPRLCFRFDSV